MSSNKPPRPPPPFNQHDSAGQPNSLSASSSHRYEDGPPPSRPERSMRRPLQTPSPNTLMRGAPDGRFPDPVDHRAPSNSSSGSYRDNGASRGLPPPPIVTVGSSSRSNGTTSNGAKGVDGDGGRNGHPSDKSRRMMDQLAQGDSSAPPRLKPSNAWPSGAPGASASAGRRNSGSSESSHSSSSRPSSPQPTAAKAPPPSAALNTAISAFSSAGARRDGRRGGLADQGLDKAAAKPVKQSAALNPTEYPDTPAFRQIESVLSKVRSEWPLLVHGTSVAPATGTDEVEKDFDPVSLAMGLLDPQSSGGRNSLSSFLRMKGELDHAISSTLSSKKSEYRAYESSITTYNSTLASLTASQRQVNELKKSLGDAREKLEGKGREGLAGMYNRMSHLEEMIKMLDEIDHLRSIPDRLEALMSDKRFLSAVVLLVRSLKTINKPEMMEIGALSDLRSWLVLQEGVLLEILIEELHNHLYLKSFYCDARYKAYSRGQSALPLVDFGEDLDVAAPTSHLEASFHSTGRSTARLPRLSKLQRYLNSLSLQSSHNPLLDEPIDDVTLEHQVADETAGYESFGSFSLPAVDPSEAAKSKASTQKNAEVDSFTYIESLVESLAVLGKLGYGLDAIAQRVQSEMFNLVEATVEEVEERNDPKQLGNRPTSMVHADHASMANLSLSHVSSTNRSSLLRLTASETSQLESSVETLRDLFWTLYSKLDAVLQGFRVTYEVSLRIAERRDFKDSSNIKASSGSLLFSLLDVWKPVQQEVRALLHDYLTDDQSGTVTSRNPIVSVNEVLRLAKPRDNSKQIFKFAESDMKASTKALKSHEDELNRALKNAVPGLMTDTTPGAAQLIVTSAFGDDRYGAGRNGPGGTHKALVKADAFNVSILFEPTWAFLERVRTIMPDGLLGEEDAGGFGGFLDEFVLRTFLPQLEEKVTTVFHQAVGGHEAFQEDPNYKKLSPVPIVKSVTNLMLLITSLCAMLRSTPFHRENYSHLIVSVIHEFYLKCQERFKDVTARDPVDPPLSAKGVRSLAPTPPPQKLSATWAEVPDITSLLNDIRNVSPTDKPAMREALMRETKAELERKGNSQIQPDDLISPSKKLVTLGTLYSSLDWFILHITALGSLSSGSPASRSGNHDGASPGVSTSSPDPDGEEDEEDSRPLPLTREMTQPFEALLASYRQLADSVLFTIRLEIRLRTMHHLDKATRDGVYQLAEDTAEPDPSVVDLNSDLAECDECAATTLAEPERRYIFEGLSLLMDELLVSNARHIRLANKFGLSKMMRNILALQQNLKNIGDSPLDVDFDHSRKFWEVFGLGPKDMMEAIKSGELTYDFEDYKTLLNLMCGIDQSSKDHELGQDPSNPPLSAGGNERSRRQYNELLIELFSVCQEVE